MVLRELFAKLGLDVNSQSFVKGELAIGVVKAGLSALVNVAKEAVEKVLAVGEAGKELKETAQATGLSTDALQEWRAAARGSGVAAEELDVGLFRVSRAMAAAKKGSEESQAAFHKLGVKVTDSAGKLRDTDAVMMDVAAGMARLPNGAEKTALAMDLFGRSGARLIPLLNKGREGIDEMRASAFKMTEEQIEAGEALQRTQLQLKNVTARLWKEAIAPLLPALNQLLQRYLAWRKANAAVMSQRIREWVGAVIKAIHAMADAFSFLVKNARVVVAVLGTVGLALALLEAKSVYTAAKSALAWGLALAPFLLLGAAVAALLLIFDDLKRYEEGRDSAFGRFNKQIRKWLEENPNDPWWLRAIKSFVRTVKDALDLLREFDQAIDRYNPKELDRRAGKSRSQIEMDAIRMTQQAARIRVQHGLPLTDAEKAALAQTGVSPEAFSAKYAPTETFQPGGASQSVGRAIQIDARANIQIDAAGMSVEELRPMIREEMQSHSDRIHENAAAALSE